MSTRAVRRRVKKGTASSVQGTSSHTYSFAATDYARPEDAPITTYVDRLSADGRRTYRESFALQPPSPVKRQRLHTSTSEPTTEPAPDVFEYELYDVGSALDDASERRPKARRPKTVKPGDQSLHNFMLKRDVFLSEFMRWEGLGDANMLACPGCGGADGLPQYRCRECGGGAGALYCARCIVSRHRHLPLHRVYSWNEEQGFFVETPLSSLGLRVQLGHGVSARCFAPEAARQGFVVLHSNGIHEVNVDFCGCEGASRAGSPEIQLLRAGWFPATHERPRTCATFEVLDRYDLAALQAKTSMYDFYVMLEKLTNTVGVKPPDRYHEWIRMCREYRHLLMLKRGRRARAYDSSGVDGTSPGELVIECPACPRPGVNLPEGWESATEDQRHLYTLFLALDACFRLKRRLVSSELRDPGLGSGWGYMVENEPYREYLRSVTDQKEMCTCTGLAALDYANTKFSRGYATTGVVMCVCARHEFVQPNGCGDLQRGERFANTDYVWGSVMRHKHWRLWKKLSYDIVCIWSILLKDRMARLPPLVRLTVVLALFSFVIPKMHIHSHTSACQLKFSLNWSPGSAQTDGEGIERPWASAGGLAASTANMGPGARHGVLESFWAYWNWSKVIGIGAMLRRRMDRARVELAAQEEALDTFSREQAERVPQWKEIVHAWERDPTQKNPYEIKVKGISEAEVRLRFSQEEEEEAARGVPALHDISPSKFIAFGLELEDEQRRVQLQAELKKAGTTGMQIDMGALRTKLNRRLTQFRKLQATYMPVALQILGEMHSEERQMVENVPLMLPSALSPAQRDVGCLKGLADMECLIRDAQCRMALVHLRNQLTIKSRLLIYKKNHSRHQGPNTRARTIVQRNESKIRLHSEKYQMAWEALRRLGPSSDPSKVGWQMLRKEDIRCMADTEDVAKKEARRKTQEQRRQRRNAELIQHGILPSEMDPGMDDDDDLENVSENRRQVSWIWTATGTCGSDEDFEDALRIEWSKAYARVRRWKEEVEVVDEEHDRVGLSFEFEALRWEACAKKVPVGVIPFEEASGAVAYARRQAAMYRDLRRRGEVTWTEQKLQRGKKRAREPAILPAARSVMAMDGMEDMNDAASDDEDDPMEEDDDELAQGEVDSDDEEYILSGAVDDD